MLSPIGYLATPFPDRFGVPRQPALAPHARGYLRLVPPYDRAEAVRGLEAFSHLWLTFVFHCTPGLWRPTVRPPRLGGNRRVGVFASRSPYRPNSLGLSLVELLAINVDKGVLLTFAGVDLVDGTPILDLKPYLPFVESRPHARAGFVDGAPALRPVSFSPQACQQMDAQRLRWPDLGELLREVLAQDPRPAYAADPQREYGLRLYDLEIKWRCVDGSAVVEAMQMVSGVERVEPERGNGKRQTPPLLVGGRGSAAL